jgi:DNA-binding response OmpR family regulator
MGGKIGFETEIGKGTDFHFSLPLLRTGESAAKSQAGAPVLVLESRLDTGRYLEMLLAKDGYAPEIVSSAETARQLLAEGDYRAMIVDIHPADGEGRSLLRGLTDQGTLNACPLIFLAADYDQRDQTLNGSVLSVIDWLVGPVDEAALDAALQRALAMTQKDNPRILHVEDDADILSVVQVMLQDVAEVIGAPTLAEARRRLKAERFNLMILDIALPDGSGLDLLETVDSETDNPMPVLILSASEPDRNLADQVAAALVKSRTSNEELLANIRKMIDRPDQHPDQLAAADGGENR